MYHFYDVVINDKTGVPRPDVIVRVYDDLGAIVPLFADEAGAVPIEMVSGIPNAAITDNAGNYNFYVNDGTYDIQFFVGDAVLYILPNILMGFPNVSGKAQADALGVPGNADSMGVFSGSIIPDNQSAKQALQALEDATEQRPTNPQLDIVTAQTASAIQSVVNSSSDNGQRVDLLKRDYPLNAALTSGSKSLEYQGAGPEATRLLVDGPRSAIEHGLDSQVYYASLAIRNMAISATNAAIGTAQTAIKAKFDKSSGGFLLENVVFRPFSDSYDFAQYVHATGATRTTFRNIRALGSTFDADSATDVQIAFRFTSNNNADKSYEYVFDDITVQAEQTCFLFEVLGMPGDSGSLEGITMTNVRGRTNLGPLVDFKVTNGGWKPPFFSIGAGFNYQGTGAIAHFDGIEGLTIAGGGWHFFDAAISGSPTLNQIQLRNARKVVIKDQIFRVNDAAKLQWVISIEGGCSDVTIEDCTFIWTGSPASCAGGIFADVTASLTVKNCAFVDWPSGVPRGRWSDGANMPEYKNGANITIVDTDYITPANAREVYVRDYGAIGDATLHTVAEWINPTRPSKFAYASLAALQVDYPHVTATTDSIDWAAIQKAVNTGRNVAFHDGRYMLGNNQIVSTTVAQAFYGLNSNTSANLGDPQTKGAIIMWTPTTSSQPAWLAKNSHQRFTGLKFWGPGTQTDSRAVQGLKDSNTDDMDISFIECEFYLVAEPIYTYGRGLTVTRCQFSQINAGYAITNDWPDTGNTGSEAQNGDLYKGRALRVLDNRLHGTGTLLRIRNFLARSAVVSNNMLDLGNSLMRVEKTSGVALTAGWLYGNLADNVADACGLTPITFGPGTSCNGLSITGGSLGGSIAATIDGATKRPFNIIQFDGCTEINGVSLNGVELHASAANVLAFSNDTSQAAITVKNISIRGGRISAFGQTGSVRAIVSSIYDMENVSIDPGSIADVGPQAEAILRTVTNKTVTNLHIGAACIQVPLTTLYTLTVGGTASGITRLSTGLFKAFRGRWSLWEQEVNATPEGSLIGYNGCRAVNLTTGDVYTFKGTDGANTGWVAL